MRPKTGDGSRPGPAGAHDYRLRQTAQGKLNLTN